MRITPPKYIFRLLFLCVAIIGIFSSCGKEQIKPTPSDFTFEVREELGSMLNEALLNNEDQFDILDKEEYADNVYFYMDAVMGQVSNLYKEEVIWDQEREWESYVIRNDAEKFAFCVPGGNFYISTGFLKQIQSDHELYYIMAFELTMMNQGKVLDKLFSLGIQAIDKISSGRVEPGDLTAEDVVLSFVDPDYKYSMTTVKEVDEYTLDYICATSDYNRFGIVDLINRFSSQNIDCMWLNTRPSYNGRESAAELTEVELDNISRCGNQRDTGNFGAFVLNYLP